MNSRQSIITLLTDFGSQDYFAGALKGVILSMNPDASIVDITHEIPAQDIHAAAFNLLACYKTFAAGAIHVAVVDPGVGSRRRGLLIECAGQFFVGPDNGLFSWICEREGKFSAWHLTNDEFFRKPVSKTFHGRDIFAPVAAALSHGVKPDRFGPAVADLVKLESLMPDTTDKDAVQGAIIHIDRFGNCITNLTLEHFERNSGAKLIVNDREVTGFREFFSESGAGNDDLFMIAGSAGFVEIAAHNASAASILNARRGQTVVLANRI